MFFWASWLVSSPVPVKEGYFDRNLYYVKAASWTWLYVSTTSNSGVEVNYCWKLECLNLINCPEIMAEIRMIPKKHNVKKRILKTLARAFTLLRTVLILNANNGI